MIDVFVILAFLVGLETGLLQKYWTEFGYWRKVGAKTNCLTQIVYEKKIYFIPAQQRLQANPRG